MVRFRGAARRGVAWAPLVAVLIVLTAVGAAAAAPRSGTVSDPEDRPANIWGIKYPDVRSLTVAYDPETGGLGVAMDLYEGTIPAANGHSDPYIQLSFEIGAAGTATRTCRAFSDVPARSGDLAVRLNHYSSNSNEGNALREHWGMSIDVAGSPGTLTSPYGSITPDRRRITWSFGGDSALVRRDYTCVTNIQMTSYPDWWVDEVSPFFFTGFAPPPPPVADRTAPTVRWQSPTDGQVISGVWQEAATGGRHACRVDARDDIGVVRVDVQLDGRFLNRELYAPWACVFDTTTVPNGTHRLTATAYDAAGNTASSTIEVVVRNPPATPQPEPPPPAPRPPEPTPPEPVTPTPATPAPAAPVATPAPAPPVAVDAVPPALRIGFASRSLTGLVRTGLVVPFVCDEACTVRFRLVVTPAVARRLRIGRLLRESTVAGAAGTRTVAILRPGPAVRRALARRRALDARLLVVATDRAGNRRVLERPVRFG